MALTDEERRYLDELAYELAAELSCSDPDLVHALTHDLAPARSRAHVLTQLLLVILLSVAVVGVGVGLFEPIVLAAACLSAIAAALVRFTRHRRPRFHT